MYRCKITFRSLTGRYYYIGNSIEYGEYSRIPFLEKKNFEKTSPTEENTVDFYIPEALEPNVEDSKEPE